MRGPFGLWQLECEEHDGPVGEVVAYVTVSILFHRGYWAKLRNIKRFKIDRSSSSMAPQSNADLRPLDGLLPVTSVRWRLNGPKTEPGRYRIRNGRTGGPVTTDRCRVRS